MSRPDDDDSATMASAGSSVASATRPILSRRSRWLIVLGVAGVVFYFSVLTSPPSVAANTSARSVFSLLPGFSSSQWLHLFSYAGLSYTLAFAIRHWSRPRWQRAVIVIVAASLYGLGIEIMQYYTPDRVFDPMDILANTIGATLVIPWYVVMHWVEIWRRDHPTIDE